MLVTALIKEDTWSIIRERMRKSMKSRLEITNEGGLNKMVGFNRPCRIQPSSRVFKRII